MRHLLLILGLLTSAQVHAQRLESPDAPVRGRVSPKVELGQTVRVRSGGTLLEGTLLETGPGSLTLDAWQPEARHERLLLTDVEAFSIRRRSTLQGAIVGASAGFLVGFPYGFMLGSIADHATVGDQLAIGGLFGLVIALPSAALGAVIGLLIPRWELAYERSQIGPLVLPSLQAPEELLRSEPGSSAQSNLSQLILLASGVLTLAEPANAIGPGLRVEALLPLGTHIAVGPEVAFHYLPVALDRSSPINEGLISFGALMRASPRRSVVTPSLLVGFSLHSNGQPATYSLGGALDVGGPEILPLTLELRWHQFNVPWKDGRQLTFGAGTRLDW